MPYIPIDQREFLDPSIDALVEQIKEATSDMAPTGFAGILNYTVTRLLVNTLPERRYWSLALGVGTMVCCIFEFYRRFVGPYEDAAIIVNKDLPEYEAVGLTNGRLQEAAK